MKVKLQEDYKSMYTVHNLEQARTVINWMKDDNMTPKEYARIAGNYVTGSNVARVVEASASTAKNCRIWNLYGDTGLMDVWIDALLETWQGFTVIGCYLSDVWQTGDLEYRQHMYIQEYVKK